jgi:hypothetical protein
MSPKDISPKDIVARLGEARANLLADGRAKLARNYHKALDRGCVNPVLMTLDLADPGARTIARRVHPGCDPEADLARAGRGGWQTAALHVVGDPESTAQAIRDISPTAAAQLGTAPPAGVVWYILVSAGRVLHLGLAVADLGGGDREP